MSRPERGGRQGGEKRLKEMGREATVREVEVEKMVHQREKQTGRQGCKVDLLKFNGCSRCQDHP